MSQTLLYVSLRAWNLYGSIFSYANRSLMRGIVILDYLNFACDLMLWIIYGSSKLSENSVHSAWPGYLRNRGKVSIFPSLYPGLIHKKRDKIPLLRIKHWNYPAELIRCRCKKIEHNPTIYNEPDLYFPESLIHASIRDVITFIYI